MENLVTGIDSISSLKSDINRLYNLYDGNAVVDTSALLSLIDANAKKLDNIMNGGKDLKLQYDTDVIQPGVGIGITKTPNKVTISSEQRYSMNVVTDSSDNEISEDNPIYTVSEPKICNIKLRPGENFAVIYMHDNGVSTSSMYINIDDNDYNWEIGQTIKLLFVCKNGALSFDNSIDRGVIIKPTNTTTLSISGYDFEGNDFVEIVCIGENKFIYLIK